MEKKPKKARRRWRVPIRLAFTKEGKWFCGIALLIGFAAINTGNNLLYLLLGMMLSLIVISGILCNISLSRLEVERQLPTQLFARTPCLVTLSVTNKKRFFPSFSIEIEDRIGQDQATGGKSKKCYFLKVGAGRTQKTAYRLYLERRGEHQFQELRVSSKFPFSLFIKTRVVPLEESAVVYPHLYPVEVPDGYQRHLAGLASSATRGVGSDFFSLRDMRPGDELRWIHWPSTARAGRFQVREFEDENRFQLEIMLWHMLASPHATGAELAFNAAQLDDAVELAASLVAACYHQRQPLRFSTCERRFTLGEQRHPLQAIFHHLALLQPLTSPPPGAAQRLLGTAQQANTILIMPQAMGGGPDATPMA